MKQKIIMWLVSTLMTPDNLEFVADLLIDQIENYAVKHKKQRLLDACTAFRAAFSIEDDD